ncbi:hypothetical protein BDK51DRAFT_28902 [Blyttiomyces helicus]|uniref:Uncharacterized protein n=1 Tax=Blyttiomyces helicus TaxID=388810 RepID=A0A4P9WMJ0_9FUNG|nr:hypothetical protein BDK51DRAFT_28902 [Blyttiomyces helicus]|eukprot:RKO94289.1 hypothetical protein BDK51DRAFT_28902 [Blyttiomyces helicus]
MSTQINRKNSIAVLNNSIRMGQMNGAFLLREASLLKDALDFFDDNVKEKPTFDTADNPETVAVSLLLQGVQKAQAHGGEKAYSLDDAALLHKIHEFWLKELGSSVNQKERRSAKAAASAARDPASDDDNDEDEVSVNTVSLRSKKGKAKEIGV